MKMLSLLVGLLVAGCASQSQVENPAMRPGGPDWAEVDKSVQRIKERERNKARFVETGRSDDQGFGKMSDEDYASVLDAARSDVREADPKMSEDDIEKEAIRRADEARREYELTFSKTVRSTYEWKRP